MVVGHGFAVSAWTGDERELEGCGECRAECGELDGGALCDGGPCERRGPEQRGWDGVRERDGECPEIEMPTEDHLRL